MIKESYRYTMLALPLALSLAIVGCGSGGSGGDNEPTGEENGSTDGGNSSTDGDNNSVDGDNNSVDGDDSEEETSPEETSDAHPVLSNVWAGATCSEYDVDIYFKSLYQFSDNGELLTGAQMYQDEACTIKGSGYRKPEADDYFSTSYSIGAIETLADGTSGYPVHYELTTSWPEIPEEPTTSDDMDSDSEDSDSGDTDSGDSSDQQDEITIADAYLGIKDNTLCYSSNVYFDTEVMSLERDGDVSVIDYDHCLVLFGSVDDLPDTSVPFPETDPEEERVELTNTDWLADNICYQDEEEGGSYQRAFSFLFHGVITNSSFVDYSTSDCTGQSRPDHIAWTENQGEFTDLGEETLSDGVVGHRIQITNPATNLSETVGFYVINELDQLCLSYNLGMNSDTNASSTDIDYEHCLKPYNWADWDGE